MEKAVSAAAANRHFSRVLRTVRDGQSYAVTSHGRAKA
jgi:prevent-host-death family protein